VEDDELNTRQTRAILALLTAKTLAEAAKKAGVGESTLREWMGQLAFRTRLRAARAQLIDETITALVRESKAAVAALVRNLDPKKPPEVQVRAAKALLDQLAKVMLADLQAQIDDLREQVALAHVEPQGPMTPPGEDPPGGDRTDSS
jgi:hypothetical protein